jgi:transposase
MLYCLKKNVSTTNRQAAMGKIRVPILSSEQQSGLEEGYRHGKGASFRRRCQMILLKAQGRTSEDVGSILNVCGVSVNTWLDRWEVTGIDGLKNRPGQGKKPILDASDAVVLSEAVKNNRQQLKLARLEAQAELKKEFSLKTLKRFLKKTAVDTNASANARVMRPMRKNTPIK